MRKPEPNLTGILLLAVVATAVFTSCSKKMISTGISKASHDSTKSQTPIVVSHPLLIDTASTDIQKLVEPSIVDPYFNSSVKEKVVTFYRLNAFNTKWLYDNSPSALYYAAFDAMKNAAAYGLDPEDYDVDGMAAKLRTVYQPENGIQNNNKVITDLDLHFSEMFFLFTTHLAEGRIRSAANGKNVWKRTIKEYSSADVNLVLTAAIPDQLIDAIIAIQPHGEQYVRLQSALAYYRQLESQSPANLPAISVKAGIKPGERNAAIPLIRKKMSLADMKVYAMPFDSVSGVADSLSYDPDLVEGVKSFQSRHGLQSDGVIGEKTLRFMNQSFRDKAEVIALNMERMRWLPDNHGVANYISINVPEYKLRVFDDQKQTLEMKVIVGASNKPTPIFADELEHIVFSPTWTVPTSIIKEEIIPNLRKDSLYYSKKNFLFFKNDEEIDPIAEYWSDSNINPYQYRVIQNPGTDNSLGSVKFMMPNNMSVYLHDTPNHKLFAKDYRALSHGCVRLDEPAKFAEYLLRDQKGWTPERIVKAMNETTPSTIHLKKHYQVFIEYCTAWVDDNGVINFREDIYGHDKAQLKQLKPARIAATASIGN
ncbi:MAG: L,D-transpeptidase family protein [Chryseolinea sp.]